MLNNNYTSVPFPSHDINPEDKDGAWLLKFAKAAWGDCTGQGMFYHARDNYTELRSYAVAKQTIDRYKPSMGVDQASDTSMWNITWENRPVITKYLDIILSIMMNVERRAVATPIDALAKDKADQYFADVRAKILMKEALMQVQPELAQSPYLMPNPGEPENLEELEMQMNYGFKFNMAMEAEMGIELVQYQNNLPIKRQQVCRDIRDLGVGGYKDWLDENGKACFRDCDPANVIMSWCEKADFSDKLYVGEIIEPSIAQLSQYFDKEEIEVIKQNAKNNNVWNDNKYSSKSDKLKAAVLDIEILTWNDLVFSRMKNEFGNEDYRRRPYENIKNPQRVKELSNIEDSENGGYKSKYFSRKVECWYKIKWVIGTDLYYDFGKVENQKRDKADLSKAESTYHFYATNFNKMTAQGVTERLKPIVDEYQLTIYKIQDFKNKWLPYVIEIDLDAIESVALGKGGVAWTPQKILDLMFQTRALVVRKKDISGINVNYKAVEIHQTGMAAELQPLMADIGRLLQEMNDVTGLNPVTDGTGSGERKLKSTAELDLQATNNALAPLMFAEKMVFESLSRGCMRRLVQAVKRGQVSGVMTALGGNTVKFITVSPDISLYAWGIKIESLPTDEDYRVLFEQMGISEQRDLLRPQDIFIIKSLNNLKQAEQYLGYLTEKRLKENRAFEEKKITLASDGNKEVAVVSEQSKQQTLQVEYSLKKDLELSVKAAEKELLLLKLEYERGNAIINAESKIQTGIDQAHGKIAASHITAQASIEKQAVAAEGAIEKQKVSNEKPKSKAA